MNFQDHKNVSYMLPFTYRNYTVDRDSTQLIDRFMTVYYTLFDSDDRSAMINLYSKNALFSINCLKTGYCLIQEYNTML